MDRSSGLGFYIDTTLKKIQGAYLRMFKAQNVDLTIEQWVILQRIATLGLEASQSKIVASNFRNRATTSRVISGLCKKNLVVKQRFEGDNKRYKLELTKKGVDVIEVILPHAEALRAKANLNILESDFTIFLEVLDKIGANYDEA